MLDSAMDTRGRQRPSSMSTSAVAGLSLLADDVLVRDMVEVAPEMDEPEERTEVGGETRFTVRLQDALSRASTSIAACVHLLHSSSQVSLALRCPRGVSGWHINISTSITDRAVSDLACSHTSLQIPPTASPPSAVIAGLPTQVEAHSLVCH